jgi:hypothetical protein
MNLRYKKSEELGGYSLSFKGSAEVSGGVSAMKALGDNLIVSCKEKPVILVLE